MNNINTPTISVSTTLSFLPAFHVNILSPLTQDLNPEVYILKPTPCALIAKGFALMQPKYLRFTHEKTVCVQPHVIVKGVKNRMLKEHSRIQSNHVHVASACSLAIFVCFVWVLEIGATTRFKNYFIHVHVCVE
jgi:hypothetical protein